MNALPASYIRKQIKVSLSEAIDHDLEGWLDLLAELAGYPMLMDISYRIVGHEGDETLCIEVCGDASVDEIL